MDTNNIVFLCASQIGVPFTTTEGRKMKVEIKLHDDEGVEAVIIRSTEDSDWVKIELLEGFTSGTIAIEHLKLALRKLSAK